MWFFLNFILLKRYINSIFPKGTDFAKIEETEIETLEYLINTGPRKRFGGLTPSEVFFRETGCCDILLNVAVKITLLEI